MEEMTVYAVVLVFTGGICRFIPNLIGIVIMHWLYLSAAILCEVAGVMAMKFSAGYTKLIPSILVFVFYAIAFTLVAFAIKKIEISVAYTIWAGVGTALIALIGIFYFGEELNALKLVSIGLVILGIVGLRVSGS